ncbi:hypothetical protein [Coleofasciculus chthonoplastes]|uniref:hypothetical protein n=1 Tax=Coleofasciculus chthonoplastes TaxID=64178 RepID=UPI0032F304D7
MFKSIGITCLVTITSWSLASAGSAMGMINFTAATVLAETNPHPTLGKDVRANQQKNKSVWEKIGDLFRRKKEEGSTQGEFCSISPNLAAYITWSKQPLFLWQGTVKKIEVSVDDEFSSESISWSYDQFQHNQQSILYNEDKTGKELQLGQEYYYRVTYQTRGNDGQPIEKQKIIPFMVMLDEEWQAIAKELTNLDNLNPNISEEEQALKHTLFFEENNLFLDVVRELFSVSVPSPEWRQKTEEIRIYFCD